MDASHPQETDFFAAIGRALSYWSYVELAIAELFEELSGMPRKEAMAVIDSVVDFRLRVSFCSNLMKLKTDAKEEAELWHFASVRIGEAYSSRHQVAHFTLGISGEDKPFIAPFLTWPKIDNQVFDRLDLSDIVERTQLFNDIREGIDWFTACARTRRLGTNEKIAEPSFVEMLRPLMEQSRRDKNLRLNASKGT